jgi:hypothetical protein
LAVWACDGAWLGDWLFWAVAEEARARAATDAETAKTAGLLSLLDLDFTSHSLLAPFLTVPSDGVRFTHAIRLKGCGVNSLDGRELYPNGDQICRFCIAERRDCGGSGLPPGLRRFNAARCWTI